MTHLDEYYIEDGSYDDENNFYHLSKRIDRIIYKRNGVMHREGGPAVIYNDGSEMWAQNGKLHREEGPAVIYSHGDYEHWVNGKHHCDYGPASCINGVLYWCYNGAAFSFDEWCNVANVSDEDKCILRLKYEV